MNEIPSLGAETTLEVNPGSAEYFSFEDYKAAGINRLSIGAQSFSNAQLAALGRVHQMQETLQAFERARGAGFDNINLDLMWGLPGQTVAGALADLQQAIDLSPQHISWYQLTIEAKTEFARRPPVLPKDGFAGHRDGGTGASGGRGFRAIRGVRVCQARQKVHTQSHVLELRRLFGHRGRSPRKNRR